jgi:aromatic-L-amino-acid decarboxylase
MSSPSAPREAATLEPSPQAFRELVMAVVERLEHYLATLAEQPVSATAGAEARAARLAGGPPEEGRPLEQVLAELFDHAIPPSFNAASPGYLAYIPGGGLPHAAIADLLAGVVNRYTGVRPAAPALVEIEAAVLRWLVGVVGYPHDATGLLTSGGSLATWTALVTARRVRLGESARVLRATLYASDQVHHAVTRAAVLVGFPAENVRLVASDADFRLDLAALEAAVAADRAAGYEPFLVTGSAGTTNTGAVDPLAALADFAAREGMWFHVDAAYGGAFALTERGRRALAGMERADSLVLDPHKGLFLPYGTGAVLVRRGEELRRAHEVTADYLPPSGEQEAAFDPHAYGPELSRPWRGLRLWLPLQLVGTAAFAAALDEKLDLAAEIAAELATLAELDLVAAPQLSVLAFAPRLPADLASAWQRHRSNPTLRRDPTARAELAAALAEPNRRTRQLLAAINAPQRVFLTPTRLDERDVVRICVLSFRTHRDRLAMAASDIRSAVSAVLGAAWPDRA